MTPFLKIVADDLYQKLKGNFQDTTIIFPNKRASLFFNEYLWENAGEQTMWTPEYTSISELFSSLSDHTVGDPIYLVVKLWEVYRDIMQPQRSFDQLYGLMETMLSDFQDIDNNLVEPSKLFLNIADLKEMTDFSFLEPEQREAIEQFFGKFFDGGTSDTPLKSQFKTLWNRMTEIYERYQKTLLETEDDETMVYEGMMKRDVVETLMNTQEENREKRQRMEERLSSHTYVMVGFNVLNKTELQLFQYIRQNRDAKFYWDYDEAYTKGSHNGIASKYEAGQFILENIRQLGDELAGADVFKNMRQKKNITFIQSPTDNAQTRYIGQWTRQHVKSDEPLRQSAVILCNEELLQPVLYSIGQVPALNVTMGYPLTGTPVFSLVQALLELQVHGTIRTNTWRYRHVAAVLKHSFIQKLAGNACQDQLRTLSKGNVVFPTASRFADNDILKRIFISVSSKQLTTYLADILSMVGHSYQNTAGNSNFSLQIYKESIFVAYTVVNRLHTLQEEHAALDLNSEMLMRLILQLMSQSTIPFHGEPAIGLQVMGLLETRNLDFRNIIMLSVNEGQMPKSDKRTSLIPYTLRAAYDMTTIEKEVSLYAYYYYRLMQRADSITLLYNSNTEGGNKGEMSRFMLQTLAEKDTLFGAGQDIELRAFTASSKTEATPPITVEKTDEVMQKLLARFDQEKILSPSAINTYMKCPLKFYFNYVEGLRADDEVSDDVDKPMFGTIFHDAMHHLYQPHEGQPFASQTVRALAEDETLLTQMLNNAFATNLFHYPETDAEGNTINYSTEGHHKLTFNGTQLINRHVIKDFMKHQIEADAKMAEELEAEGGYWMILSQEKQFTINYPLNSIPSRESRASIPSTPSLPTSLLGGIIDRLDLLASPQGNRIRIVDYKTSNRQQTANKLEDLFDPEKCTENYHILQTLYYCKVLTDDHSAYKDQAVVPALMYCAKDYANNYSGIIKLTPPGQDKKAEIEDFKAQYSEAYDQLLSQKIDEIFAPSPAAFTQCENEKNCTYCDFLSLCGRHPQKQNF